MRPGDCDLEGPLGWRSRNDEVVLEPLHFSALEESFESLAWSPENPIEQHRAETEPPGGDLAARHAAPPPQSITEYDATLPEQEIGGDICAMAQRQRRQLAGMVGDRMMASSREIRELRQQVTDTRTPLELKYHFVSRSSHKISESSPRVSSRGPPRPL